MAQQSISHSPREDGRFVATAGLVHHELKRPPRMAFDTGLGEKQFIAWRARVRRKLQEVLAFPDVPRQPRPKLIWEKPRDGYRLQRWELYPEPLSAVPFLLLVPDGVTKQAPAPAVMCFPGSEQPKEAVAGEPWESVSNWKNRFGEHNLFAKHIVRAGMVAAVFDNPGTAELADPRTEDWRRQSLHMIWLGRSYEGLSVFQKWQALAWLKSVPFVDRRRIATCGHSLGAKPALALAVLDPSVKAVVWNDNAADWRRRDMVRNLQPVAPWHYIPGFALWFDYMDLMAALAPRPLLVTEGGRGDDFRKIRKAYTLSGARPNFKVTYMPNFARASARILDRKPMPEGIDEVAYARYANYDGDHYFKEGVAVPWLRMVLGG